MHRQRVRCAQSDAIRRTRESQRGSHGESTDPEDHEGDVENTPVFFGSSNVDPCMPEDRVYESAVVFARLNGDVTKRLYDGADHTITEDELDVTLRMIAAFLSGG